MQVAENMTMLDKIYHGMYITILILLALMLFACLIRAIKGPRIADRIVAVNMMGTMVMVMIAVLSLLLKEGFLVDICLIYAMVSFLAVVVISKVYMGVYREKEQEGKREQEKMQEEGGTVGGNHGVD
ncbi:MAG: cation:proton antiporter [Bacillota bacterium]|nr:cation:proton antiporter [Bacillota bacterium]